jgi:tetratricopeptide (TPR) repeat protein
MQRLGKLLEYRELTTEQAEKRSALIDEGHQDFDNEEYKPALAKYHQASVMNGGEAAIWCYLGLAYANLDLPHEAWRSYKLALVLAPDDTDTWWYAAEFLAEMEDYTLALAMLNKYMELETDATRLTEALQLEAFIREEAGPELTDAPDLSNWFGTNDPDEEAEAEANELPDMDAEDYPQIDNPAGFVASLSLQLTDMYGQCLKCGTRIPTDAPYCYNCHAPHIYGSQR